MPNLDVIPISRIEVRLILHADQHGGNMCLMPKAKKATKAKSATKAKKAPAKKKVAVKKPAKKVGAKKANPAPKGSMRSARAGSMRGCGCC
jgi:hypothetical protein